MKIALIHFRVGELDGVSLEMEKWRKVLQEDFGHSVIYLAGTLGRSNGFSMPELALDYPQAVEIREKSFSQHLNLDEEKLLKSLINKIVEQIKPNIVKFINDFNIDCLVTNNIFCYPLNIPASIALAQVIEVLNIPVINHNHDFFWERSVFVPSCSLIEYFLKRYFPPHSQNFQQVVINTSAKMGLKERTGFDSTYVPNVFNFENQDWKRDSYNSDLRESLKIKENDLIFLQGTRIVERKGIELVIDVISMLNKPENVQKLSSRPLFDSRKFKKDSKLILVMPNLIEDENYKLKLEKKCKNLNVDYRFCNESFAHQRGEKDNGTKIYSLWDAYTIADMITYPSLLEGWGNQFLEAVKAKVPIILFEYTVYNQDIGPMGFEIISLGSEYVKKENGLASVSVEKIDHVVKKTIEILQNKDLRNKIVNNNYAIGLEKFSITALREYIKPLITAV